MSALRAAAEEPARPVRESFGGLPRKVRAALAAQGEAAPAPLEAPAGPADVG